MSKVLVAGPCISELGWEICEWQGYIRKLAQSHDKVVVCSTAGHLPLYADMHPIFIPHHIVGRRDCHRMRPGSITNPDEMLRVRHILDETVIKLKKEGYTVTRIDPISTRGDAVGTRHPIEQQDFVKYGDPSRVLQPYPIVIHARARRDNSSFTGDNYPEKQWTMVLAALAANGFSRVAAIGTLNASIAPVGSTDCRGQDLRDTMDVMAAARVVVGPSSGPMHLASLCQTAHVVWTGRRQQPAIEANNKVRYKQLWNPFKTPVHVIINSERSTLPPEKIVEATLSMLGSK